MGLEILRERESDEGRRWNVLLERVFSYLYGIDTRVKGLASADYFEIERAVVTLM